MNPDIIHLAFASILIIFFCIVIYDWLKRRQSKSNGIKNASETLDVVKGQLSWYKVKARDCPASAIKYRSLLQEQADLESIINEEDR